MRLLIPTIFYSPRGLLEPHSILSGFIYENSHAVRVRVLQLVEHTPFTSLAGFIFETSPADRNGYLYPVKITKWPFQLLAGFIFMEVLYEDERSGQVP